MAERRAGGGSGPRSGRWLLLVQVGQFALAGLIALAIVGLATAVASRRIGEREAVSDARTTTVTKAQGLVEPAIDEALLDGDPDAVAGLDEVVTADVLDQNLVRVKLWTEDGRIIYSDEPRLIGSRFDLGADEIEAIDSGRIEAEVSDLDEPENRYERSKGGKLLEVYLPVHSPSGEPLLLEAYFALRLGERERVPAVAQLRSHHARRPRDARARADPARLLVGPPAPAAPARAGGAPATRAGRVRGRAPPDRERPPRRRRAGPGRRGLRALGVGSDRRGASGRPAAAGAVGGDGPRERARAALADRRPLPAEPAGGRPASRPCATSPSEPGSAASRPASTVPEELDRVPDGAAGLLYRSAQEGLRNVVDHAQATTAQVSLRLDDRTALLEVVDDGRGFDDRAPRRPCRGRARGPQGAARPAGRRRRLTRRAVDTG